MKQALTELCDSTLICHFATGSNAALEEIIRRYKDKMYTSIYLLVKDRNLSEDIFQDAFIKIIKTIRKGGYQDQGKFLPWALRICHNLCIDHFRRVRRHIPVTTSGGEDLHIDPPCLTMPTDGLLRRQNTENVRKLIMQLPDEQREVLTLRMDAELTFKEIANVTGVSINTALGRMRYALINMRKMIETQELELR